jgi:sulfatase maturation enzyme AslB (radical SAM superfamily)
MIPIVPVVESGSFPNKNFKGRYCLSPFINAHIDHRGEVDLCPCPKWGDTRVGNILEESFDSMLSSPRAQNIRQSIINGNYNYCSETKCALIINDQLNTVDTLPKNVAWQIEDPARYELPYEIAFHGDRTCNLSCPSCRTHVIKVSEENISKQKEIAQNMFQNIFSQPSNRRIHLTTSGAGEVFASSMIQHFLSLLNLTDFPHLVLSLHSNGLLIEKNWHCVEHIASSIDAVTISVDAAKADTYEKIRRGGLWPNLLKSLEFLQNKKHILGFKFNTRMIVQKSNFEEIVDFYHLCKSYDVDRIEYARVDDRGTWTRDEFKIHDVFGDAHNDRLPALELINKVKSLPDTWFDGDFN